MPLRFDIGDEFPNATLTDERGQKTTLEAVAEGQPLILAFYRGPW